MVQNQWRNKIIRCTTPASLLKNPQLNCKTNTGHIHKVKHPPESCNSQLSDALKKMKNGSELVEK